MQLLLIVHPLTFCAFGLLVNSEPTVFVVLAAAWWTCHLLVCLFSFSFVFSIFPIVCPDFLPCCLCQILPELLHSYPHFFSLFLVCCFLLFFPLVLLSSTKTTTASVCLSSCLRALTCSARFSACLAAPVCLLSCLFSLTCCACFFACLCAPVCLFASRRLFTCFSRFFACFSAHFSAAFSRSFFSFSFSTSNLSLKGSSIIKICRQFNKQERYARALYGIVLTS